MSRISWPAERLLTPQEELCYVEQVFINIKKQVYKLKFIHLRPKIILADSLLPSHLEQQMKITEADDILSSIQKTMEIDSGQLDRRFSSVPIRQS
jgi:hypothetical protein